MGIRVNTYVLQVWGHAYGSVAGVSVWSNVDESIIERAMPHVIRWEHHGLVRKFWGHVGAAEFESAIQQALSDTRFHGVRYSILDFSEVSRSDIDMALLERMAMLQFGNGQLCHSRVKVALIGPHEVISTLLSSSIHPPIDGSYDVGRFGSEGEAREWIHQKMDGAVCHPSMPGKARLRPPIRRTPGVLRPRQFRHFANGDRRTLV
jgi:hypothetical protein